MSDKYKELLDAVHALDPNKEFFTLRANASGRTTCTYCLLDNTIYGPKHTTECPVTLLRNVLNEVEEARIKSMVHVVDEPEVMITMEAVTQKIYGLAPLKQEGKCPDPLMFYGISDSYLKIDPRGVFDGVDIEDFSLELHTEYIKSPTDNGV